MQTFHIFHGSFVQNFQAMKKAPASSHKTGCQRGQIVPLFLLQRPAWNAGLREKAELWSYYS